MNTDRELLEQQRDQAVRDILDLERQVADHEIPHDVAEELRQRYETAAAQAIDALETAPATEPGDTATPRGSRARLVSYLVAAALAIVVAVLLPQYVSSRPPGGAVTGNEVLEPEPNTAAAPPTALDPSSVSDAELEAAVAANPTAIGMRLALADRYLAAADYDKAADHYGVALQQDPGNPEVLGGAGWLLFKMGKVDDGLRFVDQALLVAPDSPDTLWYKANILLDGRKDVTGALEVLRPLTKRADLPDGLLARVNQLITRAERAGGG